MKKRILIIATIVLVIALAATLLVGCKKEQTQSIEPTTFTKEWLSNIKDDTKITKIAIPGSHDSGSIGMTANFCTQNESIGKQMELGVRYFDIRVKKKDNNLIIFHDEDEGVDFLPILDDIKAFIDSHKSEFLILDFQHFANGSESDVKLALANKGILDIVVKNTGEKSDLDFVDSLTLGDVRGKVIIMWGRDESEEYLFRRNNDDCTLQDATLDSLYSYDLNAKPSKKFISDSLPIYMEHILQKEKGLTVLQGQLTRGVFNLGGSIISMEQDHNKNMTDYVYKIAENQEQLNKINIIMRDFIEADSQKVLSILSLNANKGIVKDDVLASYQEITKKQ